MGANVEGRITQIAVQAGDRVVTGQVLAKIHSHEIMDSRAKLAQARIAVQQAESDLRLATSQSERAERLYAARAMSQADLDRARTATLDATSRRSGAEVELERATAFQEHLVGSGPLPAGYDEHEVLIRSPIDGVVISRAGQEGMVVTIGAPLVVVSRTSALVLLLHVPEQMMGIARVGSAVRFTVAGQAGRTFAATVARVSPAVDTLTRTIEIQASVSDPTGELKAEQFVTADLMGSAGSVALAVPAGAVQAFEGDTVVIVADRRGEGLRLEAVRVKVGRRTADWAELLQGADTSLTVVTTGAAVAKAEILKRRSAN
jgi:cobalt-zinc-cadmium efflux system membrane fusion protein